VLRLKYLPGVELQLHWNSTLDAVVFLIIRLLTLGKARSTRSSREKMLPAKQCHAASRDIWNKIKSNFFWSFPRQSRDSMPRNSEKFLVLYLWKQYTYITKSSQPIKWTTRAPFNLIFPINISVCFCTCIEKYM